MTIKPPGVWPPPTNPFRVDGFDLRVVEGPHPIHVENAEAIKANWRVASERNPHLFNGPMLLQRRVTLDGGIIRGVAQVIPYAAFLWWRKQPEMAGALHLFGFAVPVSSDGAIVAIRMSERTSSPGKVYCAAGSLDLADVADNQVDLVGNMRREVREETGIDLDTAQADAHFHASHDRNRIVVFRFYRFAMSADAMAARIEAHMRQDPEQEIDAAVIVRSSDRAAHDYSPAMYPILDMFFARADK
ncbi:NUDIX hydrolase [Neorhizobium sp. NPDC001467]|uniref:NUDIX hydrolase n=1 Tax=Neorhizobium sp. NPDC001467 TaxID=3390595 RepID=UPI003D024005